MSASESIEDLEELDELDDLEAIAVATDLTTAEIGRYVCDLAHGMRQVTQRLDQRDIRFLDYLLAILESEANKVAEHSYH